MNPEPMEDKLLKQWNLNTEKDIKAKIFEDYAEGDKLTHILDGEKLVACSYALGRILASYNVGLKTAQLRRFYGSLLNIKASANRVRAESGADNAFKSKIIPQILMLKPLLANAKAKQRRAITPFFEVINPLFDVVKDGDDYDRFCDFVEAIVAYHKYCGGKD